MIWSIFSPYWEWVFASLDKLVGFEMTAGAGVGVYETWITAAIYWNVWLALIIPVAFLSILCYRLALNADKDLLSLEKRSEHARESFWTVSIIGTAVSFGWPVIVWMGLVLLYPLPILLGFASIWLLANGIFKANDGAQYLYGLKKARITIRKKQDEVSRLKRLNDPAYQESMDELETWLIQERTSDYADKDRQAVGA